MLELVAKLSVSLYGLLIKFMAKYIELLMYHTAGGLHTRFLGT